ncbi:unnamed protein product [Aureobasidium uvarum]|uniref:RING-type domain-containing protein n=1 Tax=Aureobasidium uvarum TaxID=2773716 RepID=A0A9N8KB12_9PEZI|nr:unnamed protein product [Aureobasidium uvarum]
MEASSPETEEAWLIEQQKLIALMKGNGASLQAQKEPFEHIQMRYNEACGAYMTMKRNGGVPPQEEVYFNQLAEQYEEAKAEQEKLEQTNTGHSLSGIKRRRQPSSSMFVQQGESDNEKRLDSTNTSAGSKRKRNEAPDRPSKYSRLVEMNKAIKRILRALVAAAPPDKKQAAIHDSARVLDAIMQFPPDWIDYEGDGLWSFKGMITPLNHHQLINAGQMRKRETSMQGPAGAIIGDDAGLGKTLSALASMMRDKTSVGSGKSITNLVLVPTGLKEQWKNEIRRHTVREPSPDYFGLGRIHLYSTKTSLKSQLEDFAEADVVIATYSELCVGICCQGIVKNSKDIKNGKSEKVTNPDNTKARQYALNLLMVLRQMTGHVLLIRPGYFGHLTNEDVDTIQNRICADTQNSMDLHANEYLAAVRELQKSITCVICDQRAMNPRWAECKHAYCYGCLENQMHIPAQENLGSTPCKLCECPIGRLIKEAEYEKNARSRWLNDSGKVIPSSKSAEVVKLLKDWRDPYSGDPSAKAVVLTSFKDSQRFLADTFREEGWGLTILSSDMSSAERQASVDEFINDPNKYLINYDHYFNEATEQQACGRIVRIGQTEQTTLVTITVTETVDEHVRDIKRGKVRDIESIMNATRKKSHKALLRMFKARKIEDMGESDWEDEVELEDDFELEDGDLL